jgi:hypothetical protein
MRLVGLLMVQSGFKHLLTEGDKVLQVVEVVITHHIQVCIDCISYSAMN